jgi:hypothetical protein
MVLDLIQAGDTVEETETGRLGKLTSVESINPSANTGGTVVPTKWHVHFSDGKEPVFQTFHKEDDLRLVQRRPQ